MTIAASGPERFSMRVVVFMARKAIVRRFAVFLVLGMARRAFGFGVFAEQREIREVVIERIFFEVHDVGISALVIRVAACAGRVFRLLESTVKARRLLDVLGDVFVTIKAQRALLSSLETLVTLGAFAFDFRVAFDHLSRHHQGFDLGVGSFLSEYRQSHH